MDQFVKWTYGVLAFLPLNSNACEEGAERDERTDWEGPQKC